MPLEGANKKDLVVTIKPTTLLVKIKTEEKPRIEGEFHSRVILDDSSWYISDGLLIIELTKQNKQEWWKSALKGKKKQKKTKKFKKKIEKKKLKKKNY